MRRTLRPSVDQLEGKALMSGFGAPIHAPAAPAVPPGVTASVVVSTPTIAPHGSVTFSLVETNTTASPVSFAVPVSREGFQVYEGGVKVWTSNPGPPSQLVQLVTLAPGASTTVFSATWNDTGNVHPISTVGTFSVVNEFDPSVPAATVTVTDPGSSGTGTPVTPPTSPQFPRFAPKLHPTF